MFVDLSNTALTTFTYSQIFGLAIFIIGCVGLLFSSVRFLIWYLLAGICSFILVEVVQLGLEQVTSLGTLWRYFIAVAMIAIPAAIAIVIREMNKLTVEPEEPFARLLHIPLYDESVPTSDSNEMS